MSDGRGRSADTQAATRSRRAQLPLLDRLIDADPSQQTDAPLSVSAAMDVVRTSICNDLEELLNTRRKWRSWDPHLAQLEKSLAGFGLPDFASGAFNEPRRRDELCRLIEACIRRFEPRIVNLKVTLADATDKISGTLRLRIDALLHAEPAPQPIAFDTLVNLLNKNVTVLEQEA